jgi:CRISPR-associated protein Csm3
LTERKFENGIDRITAAANPRQIERVPKGAKFELEMVYTVENEEDAVKDFENLAIALAILEDDALGGHGSRGYGKVKFEKFDLRYHDYSKIAGGGHKFDSSMEKPPKNIRELLGLFDSKNSKVQQLLRGSNK